MRVDWWVVGGILFVVVTSVLGWWVVFALVWLVFAP